MKKKILLVLSLVVLLAGCDGSDSETSIIDVEAVVSDVPVSEMFTERDLEQTVYSYDLGYELTSGEDLTIYYEGTYLITGDVTNATIIVDVYEENNVQLVFEDVSVVNDDKPVVYVKSADKVFLTFTGENYFEVNGLSSMDDETLNAAIYSKDDLVLNGEGELEIVSLVNGVVSKDDLKVTGGTIEIDASYYGLKANDSIRIAGGTLTIDSNDDALHSENDEGYGYVYISGGVLDITTLDDGIRANTYVTIDGGDITINDSYEGIEATQVYINGGVIDLYSSDDGINATAKTNLDVEIVITGGDTTVEVGSGDTDGIDSNGDFTITGGTLTIVAPTSSVDVDGTISQTGGTVISNGEEIDDVSEIATTMGGRKK